MLIPLIDQRLFLCEQYLALHENGEAATVLATLEAYWEQLTPLQSSRLVHLFVQLEADEALIRYFEAGYSVSSQHLQALAYAYAREGVAEAAQALLEQLPTSQQAEAQATLTELLQAQVDQQAQRVCQLLQAQQPNWERIVSYLTANAALWNDPKLTSLIQQVVEQEVVAPPYRALLVDLGLQAQLTFANYPGMQPLAETTWVQQLEKAIGMQRENVQLFQELVTMQILQIYPQTPQAYGYDDVETLIHELQLQLQHMLTNMVEDEVNLSSYNQN